MQYFFNFNAFISLSVRHRPLDYSEGPIELSRFRVTRGYRESRHHFFYSIYYVISRICVSLFHCVSSLFQKVKERTTIFLYNVGYYGFYLQST